MNKQVTPDIEIAALDAARRFYGKLHPLEKPDGVRSKPTLYWFFLLIAISSSALAALRTGPVFFESANVNMPLGLALVEGALAVIVIDFGAAVLAFFWVGATSAKRTHYDMGKVVFSTLVFCLIIQIGANLYAVVGPVLLNTGGHETSELIIAVLVGFAAPIVAFISGHGLGVLHIQHERQFENEKLAYENARQDLLDAFETWYDARQRREWIARVQVGMPIDSPVRISKPSVPELPSKSSASEPSNEDSIEDRFEGGAKQKYTQNATERVFQLFESNPEALLWTVEEISKYTRVATGTASTARKKFKETKG